MFGTFANKSQTLCIRGVLSNNHRCSPGSSMIVPARPCFVGAKLFRICTFPSRLRESQRGIRWIRMASSCDISTEIDLDAVLRVATEAALEAGAVIREAFDKPKNIESKKNDVDLVTETDQRCEDIISSRILDAFPQHKFIGEEQAAQLGRTPDLTDAPTWLVDPLDGTTNFVHSFPFVCVCIGFAIGGRVKVGVVYNPVLSELYTAVRGRGATLNGDPIRCSEETALGKALVGTEIGVGRDEPTVAAVMDRIERMGRAARSLRCGGSCAAGLCSVARGRLDVFYEIGFGGPWDVAAASVILEEAGGRVMDPEGGEFQLMSRRVLGTNTHLGDTAAQVLAQAQKSPNEPQPL